MRPSGLWRVRGRAPQCGSCAQGGTLGGPSTGLERTGPVGSQNRAACLRVSPRLPGREALAGGWVIPAEAAACAKVGGEWPLQAPARCA